MSSVNAHPEAYYRVWFIWIKDGEKFAEYQRAVAPVVGRYACSIERSLRPEIIYFEGLRKPDIVNIVKCDSEKTFLAFEGDRDFRDVVHLRSESTELLSIDCVLSEQAEAKAEDPDSRPGRRFYTLEIAQFRAQGKGDYLRYERRAERLMRNYGYHVERTFNPVKTFNMPFTPDVVKLAYFDSREGMQKMEQDPAHGSIEKEYPSVVRQSIWIMGQPYAQYP
jgi:hypothetical protein